MIRKSLLSGSISLRRFFGSDAVPTLNPAASVINRVQE